MKNVGKTKKTIEETIQHSAYLLQQKKIGFPKNKYEFYAKEKEEGMYSKELKNKLESLVEKGSVQTKKNKRGERLYEPKVKAKKPDKETKKHLVFLNKYQNKIKGIAFMSYFKKNDEVETPWNFYMESFMLDEDTVKTEEETKELMELLKKYREI